MGLPPEEESFPIREKYYSLSVLKKLKLSHYTPRRRLGGEEAQLPLILELGSRWG
jgi:hypothetical protein